MIWQIVPTDSSPNCRRNALLSIGGVKTLLALFFRYNPAGEYWTMDVSRAETGETLLTMAPGSDRQVLLAEQAESNQP